VDEQQRWSRACGSAALEQRQGCSAVAIQASATIATENRLMLIPATIPERWDHIGRPASTDAAA
jgi:hypothetical protein